MRTGPKLAFIFTLCLLATLMLPISSAYSAAPTAARDPLVVGSEGINVYLMQKRLADLGFYTVRSTGIYGSITRNAVIAFQRANDITSDGTVGDETFSLLFSSSAKRPFASNTLSQEKGSKTTDTTSLQHGIPATWADINEQMKIGKAYTVTDYYTQTSFSMMRTGGTGHADVECSTRSDFSKFLSIFGGTVSWEKRPVLVKIGAIQVAASLYGMPHGYLTITTTGMSGHTCLYFSGSTLDEPGLSDVEHEKMVNIAAGR